MRSNIIQKFLDEITDEDRERFRKETDEFLVFQAQLESEGYKYNTDKSFSLKLLNDAGHYPIGITCMMCEETFIFRSSREANKAWKSRILGYDGWWYGLKAFQKAKREYKNEIKVYWLNEKDKNEK